MPSGNLGKYKWFKPACLEDAMSAETTTNVGITTDNTI